MRLEPKATLKDCLHVLRLHGACYAAATLLAAASPSIAAAGASAAHCALHDLPGSSAQFQRAGRETGLDTSTTAPAGSPTAPACRIADFRQVTVKELGLAETGWTESGSLVAKLPSSEAVTWD